MNWIKSILVGIWYSLAAMGICFMVGLFFVIMPIWVNISILAIMCFILVFVIAMSYHESGSNPELPENEQA